MARIRPSAAVLFVFFLLAGATVVSAQNVSTSPEGLTFHGFIDATGFFQNQNFTFGNGQNAEFPVPPQSKTDRWFLDGDVRNTRLTLGFNGPKLEDGLKLNATLEMDFFGGFNGTGGFSNAQLVPRLRLGYLDLVRGDTTIRIGQAWTPLFGVTASSYSHIAFPLGYGAAGDVGWRAPGVFWYQNIGTSKFTLGVFRNIWSVPADATNSQSAGPASGLPQIEARYDLNNAKGAKKTWNVYFVGHWDKKDLSGAGAEFAKNDTLTGTALEVGGKVTAGTFVFQGNAYTGKAIGQQFGQIAQFGDIASWGAWIQPGFNFTKKWSGYVFLGTEKPKKEDVIAAKATRVKNAMIVPSIMYNNGPYGINIEWLHDTLTTTTAGGVETDTKGDQFAISAIFKF